MYHYLDISAKKSKEKLRSYGLDVQFCNFAKKMLHWNNIYATVYYILGQNSLVYIVFLNIPLWYAFYFFFKFVPSFYLSSAVPWLKYCRYGVNSILSNNFPAWLILYHYVFLYILIDNTCNMKIRCICIITRK